MSETLAFFGGTFDPVHHGHLIVARSIVEQAGLDRITFVPTGIAPHKAHMHAPAEHRLAMLKLAVASHPEMDVSDIELRRSGRSFTFDTLTELRRQHGQAKLLWVIGLDMLEDLPRWYRAAELVREFDFLVALRPPWQVQMPRVHEQLVQAFGPADAQRLTSRLLATPLIEISSTEIRARVAAGKSVDWMIPPAVEQYVRENGLYGRR